MTRIVELGDKMEARFEPANVGIYEVERGPDGEVINAKLRALLGPRSASILKGELAAWLEEEGRP